MSHTLIIRPTSGNFIKDFDAIGKMDPYVKVTINNQIQKTDIASGQGKTPKWKKPLSFKITAQEYSRPQDVMILFEAFDDDVGSDDFIGKFTMRLSDVNAKPGKPTILTLYDKKNANMGTIEVFFEFVQSAQGNQASPQKIQRHVIGTIGIKPTHGKFDSLHDHQEMYLVFTHGDVGYQTNTSEGTGKKPIFRDIISFQQFEGEDMIVKCFDNDPEGNDMIGEGKIPLTTIQKRGSVQTYSVSMTNDNKEVGLLNVEIEFFADIFDAPVKIYPPVTVRKGEAVSKKIRYNNPDNFKKTLEIKSWNDEIVFVKNHTLVILPKESGEIRFRFTAPNNSRAQEEKCRIDITNNDTKMIEESLLFKIRGI